MADVNFILNIVSMVFGAWFLCSGLIAWADIRSELLQGDSKNNYQLFMEFYSDKVSEESRASQKKLGRSVLGLIFVFVLFSVKPLFL